MSESIRWNDIGLNRNPFNLVPDKDSRNLVWAGFSEIKNKFIRSISECLNNVESKLTLVISRYGGGKTHSSYYYSREENFPRHDGISPFSLVVQTPKDGSYAADEFYTQLIDRIKISRLSKIIKSLRRHYNDESISLEKLQEKAKSEDLGRILWLLGDSDEDISFLAEQMVFGGNPNATTKTKLKIRRGIQSNSDKAQVLSCIFRVISKFNENEKLSTPRKVFLWIDELESLIFYSSKQYRPFTQTIRELIDFTPKHLAIFMNFSFADPSDVSNVELVIGEALLDRINNQIVFDEATMDESLEYVKDLLGFYYIDENKPDFFPFTESIVRNIIERGPQETGKPLMPRSINKWFQYVLGELNSEGLLIQNPEISLENVQNIDLSSSKV